MLGRVWSIVRIGVERGIHGSLTVSYGYNRVATTEAKERSPYLQQSGDYGSLTAAAN